MVSKKLTVKAAKKGKSIAGIPGLVIAGALVLVAQFVAEKKLKRYFGN